MNELLRSIYYDPRSPGSLGGVRRLAREVKARGHKVKLEAIKDWLAREETYTLYKPVVRKFARNRVRVSGPYDVITGDLVDVSNLAEYNSGVRYLLILIDVFTKKAQVWPLMRKDAISVSTALKSAFNSMLPNKIKHFWSDKGGDFRSGSVTRVMNHFGITQYNTENETIKSSVGERYIRTLRNSLARYMHANNTNRFLEALPDIVASYNDSYHTSIKMKPNDVSDANKGEVFVNLYGGGETFEKGDPVRMAKTRHAFTKGYHPGWTGEVFYVKGVNKKHEIPTYKVREYGGDDIIGTFYRQELQKIVPPDIYKIERVLRTRKRNGRTEYFVKWLHYPHSANSWVTDIITNG